MAILDDVTRQATIAVALRWTAATSLLVGAGIHALAVAPHSEHWVAAGLFFAVLAAVQATAAALLVSSRSRLGPAASAAVSVLTVALWLVTRTTGLPFGPGAGVPEDVSLGDVISTASSLMTLTALVPLLRLPTPRSMRLAGALGGAMSVAAPVVLVGALFVAMPSIRSHAHDHGDAQEPASVVVADHPHADTWPPVTTVANAAPTVNAAKVQALVEAAYEKGQAEEP